LSNDQTEPNKSNERRRSQAFSAPAGEAKGTQTDRHRHEHSNSERPFKRHREHRGERPDPLYISVVIPLLNEEGSLPELAERLEKQLSEVAQGSWEVIFVDDGSTDKSYEVIREIHRRNHRFKAIRFRRNYGKSAALAVGFAEARGKFVITMDADLQDDPAEIPALLNTLKNGYDLVSGWKRKRYDPISKTLPSKLFNWVTSKASGIKLHDFNCGLKGYRREVVKSLQVYGEMHRYLPALAHWDGFKVTEIPVQHHPRIHGHSKFGASRFLKGFLDLLTVLFTTRYTKRPLHLFGMIGALFALTGFVIDLYLTIEWMFGLTNLSNRPLAIFGIGLIIVGVQLISIGLIAELIVKNSMQNFKYNIQERL
jgi:glycosyltransferase involved in cell wall biosynthesis